MQARSASPVQPQVHAAAGGVVVAQGDSHAWMHSANLSEGHAATQALRSSPSHPQAQADGLGVGEGLGAGGVGGGGVGDAEPLVTSGSYLRDATEDLSQHSWLARTQVKPTQPEAELHAEQQPSALLVCSAVSLRFVPSLFWSGVTVH